MLKLARDLSGLRTLQASFRMPFHDRLQDMDTVAEWADADGQALLKLEDTFQEFATTIATPTLSVTSKIVLFDSLYSVNRAVINPPMLLNRIQFSTQNSIRYGVSRQVAPRGFMVSESMAFEVIEAGIYDFAAEVTAFTKQLSSHPKHHSMIQSGGFTESDESSDED